MSQSESAGFGGFAEEEPLPADPPPAAELVLVFLGMSSSVQTFFGFFFAASLYAAWSFPSAVLAGAVVVGVV
ncbi:MAG TPA: hypothetical protein VKH63_00965 [Candidatus Acidoferrum sp.]|nr:hypothetical protein [Candidatus Acidoferrum sp.]